MVGNVSWDTGHDESVEVNQRALIDKVLARYSGEFTVFRELLQNSDDARSKAAEIHFKTKLFMERGDGNVSSEGHSKDPSNFSTAQVYQWVFKNNGDVFRDEDWDRLKKIAEGNPDEEKIGAFGVGFYSVFSITEEPLVTSGDRCMAFYWKDKKDQLLTRRGTLPSVDRWTTFQMTLREANPMPCAFDLTRFVASSLTFMQYLSEVSIYFDGTRLAKLTKTLGDAKTLKIPRGLKYASPLKITNVTAIQTAPLHIKAEVMRCVYAAGTTKPRTHVSQVKEDKSREHNNFFSSFMSSIAGGSMPQVTIPEAVESIDLLKLVATNVSLFIYTARVNVKLTAKLGAELHRSTKKNPPSKLYYKLIYTSKDEYDASLKEDLKQSFSTGSVFQSLRADLEGKGSARVFIGHATGQTTGIAGHMATQFIPTVERETIDLVDRNVAIWNKELLNVGGFLARVVYELELSHVRALWSDSLSRAASPPNQELKSRLYSRCLHALKFFTFHQSTPSSDVSSQLEAAFFSCSSPEAFSIISTAGVLHITEVRVPSPIFADFMKRLPVLPNDILKGAELMLASLQNKGMLKKISFQDVLNELRSRPLPEDEMIVCLNWWISLTKQGMNSRLVHIRTALLEAAVLTTSVPGSPEEKILKLTSIKAYINMTKTSIPFDSPLPDHVIPLNVSRHFDPIPLSASFPWYEMSIPEWLQYVAISTSDVEHDITKSASWAEQVLKVLGYSWLMLSNDSRAAVCSLLNNKACIPTSSGMSVPEEAYFSNANVFDELRVVALPSGMAVTGNLQVVMTTLGVRKHVELETVFSRMVQTGNWSVLELVNYLVAIQASLTSHEMERLAAAAVFCKEGDPANGDARLCLRDLYEPIPILRQLGLPILNWDSGVEWHETSEEARFLHRLGLRRFPPLKDLVGYCASIESSVRVIALAYLLDNFVTQYSESYDPVHFIDVPFIPALDKNSTFRIGTLTEVFSNPDWAALGFLAVHPDMDADAPLMLKIKEHPETSSLASLLHSNPPKDEETAREWFNILAKHITHFAAPELSQIPIVPTRTKTCKGRSEHFNFEWLPPNQCFLGGGNARAQRHNGLFAFVDFDIQGNSFLRACGSKDEPSVEDVVETLLADPRRFFGLINGRNNFLVELRDIASNRRQLSSDILSRMKESPILLGSRRIKREIGDQGEIVSKFADLDEDNWDLKYGLLIPDQVVIADDINGYQLFSDSFFVAPQEDILEDFYMELGSPRLTSLVEESYEIFGEIRNSKTATDIRNLVLERLPLFLHEHAQSRARIQYSWLAGEGNFIVKEYKTLTVTKSLKFGNTHPAHTQDGSAAARRDGDGPVELLLGPSSQQDMYEVATSLCRLLFVSPEVHDALLFQTILSTGLEKLKGRGYNVDRILRQHRRTEQAVENKGRGGGESAEVMHFPSAKSPKTPSSSAPRPPLPSGSSHTFSLRKLKRRFIKEPTYSDMAIPSDEIQNDDPPSRIQTSGPIMTSSSNISSNIRMAIKACTQEKGRSLHNRDYIQIIKESLDESYCDISVQASDLTEVGVMDHVKVYITQDTRPPPDIMGEKGAILARFIHVMKPLVKIYDGLSMTSLHIFYDLKGEMIAFNRNASIFLNLRYYERRHDADVRAGRLSEAYISWYFTLAHEIAHNLVQPHNFEHEFYFSAICQTYIVQFGKLLSSI